MAGHMKLQVWKENVAVDREGVKRPASTVQLSELDTLYGHKAWWGEYSAPGYMDKTDPVGPNHSPERAAVDAFDMYGDLDSLADRQELVEVMRNLGVPYARIAEVLGIDTDPEWAVKAWVREED